MLFVKGCINSLINIPLLKSVIQLVLPSALVIVVAIDREQYTNTYMNTRPISLCYCLIHKQIIIIDSAYKEFFEILSRWIDWTQN